jgi:radical SAM protein with 4Fe4S-binding SPASM domain
MEKDILIPEQYKYISAFLTMRCNLGCGYCLNNIKQSEDFNRKKFLEIHGEEWVNALNRIESRPNVPVTFSGGEPFLHRDFISIINGLRPGLEIDILTNLQWGREGIARFIDKVNPRRIKRDCKYASIRVSYHPDQMDAAKLVKDVGKMQEAGFSIGIWSVLYPSPANLSSVNQMQFLCRDAGIEFRLKEFTGKYKGEVYGDYTKYPGAALNRERKECSCKTSEFLIGPDGRVYRCHRDLFLEENPMGSIRDKNFQVEDIFRKCTNYGDCHPCDVKVKTNYKQERGHTSVEIKDIK